jgi:ERCC4-type nuclease
MVYGIPLLRSGNPEETARLMFYASLQMSRTARGLVPRPGYRPKGKRKRQLYILQGLPGVGPVRAARLLTAFGSLRAVVGASREALAGVAGIGVELAEKIHMILN